MAADDGFPLDDDDVVAEGSMEQWTKEAALAG